jgi:predicted nucleic acid-binding protein
MEIENIRDYRIDLNHLLNECPFFDLITSYGASPIVIDTNIIRQDITRVVRGKASSTKLIDLASRGCIIIYFPESRLNEVYENLREISSQYKIDYSFVENTYRITFGRVLRLVTIDMLGPISDDCYGITDQDDIIFWKLYLYLNAPLFRTNNSKHFKFLGDRASHETYVQFVMALDQYHVGEEVLYSLRLGGYSVTFVGVASVFFAFELFKGLIRVFKKVPIPLIVTLFLLIFLGLFIPKVRKSLKQFALNAGSFIKNNWSNICDLIDMFSDVARSAQELKIENLTKIGYGLQAENALSDCRHALDYIEYALINSPRPLSAGEVADRIQKYGYQSVSKNLKHYVKKILRGNILFSKNDRDEWIFGRIESA